jgi:hypothetical protein
MNPRGPLSVPQLDAAVDLMGRTGRRAVLPMRGESMTPTLRAGQLIDVALTPCEPELGDLLLYRQQDYLVVHRYLGPASWEDGAPRFRTRGDARLELDPPLERARVRGRVLAIEEHGRGWSLDGGGARAWAMAVGLHDLAWAAIGVLAGSGESALARVGLRVDLRSPVARTDRAMLGLAHRLLFRALHHSSASRPAGAGPGTDRAPSRPVDP